MNKNHLDILKSGVLNFNIWRKENPDIIPDLSDSDLGYMDLRGANLTYADLRGANLSNTNLGQMSSEQWISYLSDHYKKENHE